MNKIVYLVELSFKQLKKTGKQNGTFFLSIYLGMLIPFYCLSSIAFLNQDVEFYNPSGKRTANVVDIGARTLTEPELLSLSEYLGQDIVSHIVVTRKLFPALDNTSVFVLGVDKGFEEVRKLGIVQGRYFTDSEITEGKRVCVAGKLCAKKYGLEIGETITIDEETYEIIGITDNSHYQKYMVFSLQTLANQQIFQQGAVQQTIHLTGKIPEKSHLQMWLNEKNIDASIYQIYNMEQMYKDIKATIEPWKRLRILAAIASVLFAMMNISMVVIGKMEEYRKSYAVKLALGAGKGSLYGSFLIENITIALFANVLLFVTISKIAEVADLAEVMVFDNKLIFQILILTLVLCAIVSAECTHYINRISIARILQEEDF